MSNRAQDPAELFDVLRGDGTPTGEVKERAAIHRDGDWHRALHVWVAGDDGTGPFLLVQRRSLAKDTWPGYLDVTVGGHYRSGEGLEHVLREAEEEIGVQPALDQLRPLGARLASWESDSGTLDREVQDVFFWRSDAPLAAYAPNPDELIELIKIPLEPLLDLLSGGAEAVAAESLRATDRSMRGVTIHRNDFIATIDQYFYRCAIAIWRALRGEAHVVI